MKKYWLPGLAVVRVESSEGFAHGELARDQA